MKFYKLNRTINYLFLSTLRSFYTYIFIIIFPIIIESFLYFYIIKNNIISSRSVAIGPLVFLTIVITSLFIANLICNWRETIFLKQLNNFGVNKKTFLTSLFVVYLSYCLFSIILVSVLLLVFDSYSSDKKIINLFINIFNKPSFLLILLNIFLNIFVIYFLSLFISGFFRNLYLINSLNLLLIIFLVVTGDYLLEFKFNQSIVYQIISYFNPQKYLNWIFYISYTNSFNGSYMLYKITESLENFFPFKNIYVPFFSILFITLSLGYISYISLNLSIKK